MNRRCVALAITHFILALVALALSGGVGYLVAHGGERRL